VSNLGFINLTYFITSISFQFSKSKQFGSAKVIVLPGRANPFNYCMQFGSPRYGRLNFLIQNIAEII
jgi:hypothetical protein